MLFNELKNSIKFYFIVMMQRDSVSKQDHTHWNDLKEIHIIAHNCNSEKIL